MQSGNVVSGMAAGAPKTAGRAGRHRRNRGESADLGFAWIATALIGCASISVTSTIASVWRPAVPVTVMLVYLVFALRRQTRNTQRLADSVYFLGFLWTLYALIDSLIRGGGGITADRIFTIFGYALVTTAVGMFIRLALIQFQRTVDDQLEDAQDDIDTRVKSFVDNLTRATLLLDHIAAQLADHDRKLATEIEGLQKRIQQVESTDVLMSKAMKSALSPVNVEAEQFAARVRELGGNVGTVSQQLARVKTDLTGVESAFRKLPEVTAPVAQGLRGLGAALTDVLTFLRRATTGDRR
jgi:hypothetical protein